MTAGGSHSYGPWSDPSRIETMSALWAGGLSAKQIAVALSKTFGFPFTRNAVIAKIHRLGLSKRDKGPKQPTKRTRTTPFRVNNTQAAPTVLLGGRKAPTPEKEPELLDHAAFGTAPEPVRLKLMDLTGATCKWPVGDPRSPSFFFCGVQKPLGYPPYCPYHCRIAYNPPASRLPGGAAQPQEFGYGKQASYQIEKTFHGR